MHRMHPRFLCSLGVCTTGDAQVLLQWRGKCMLGASSARGLKAFCVRDLVHVATGALGACEMQRVLWRLGGTIIHSFSSCLMVEAGVNGWLGTTSV